ncbi:MAG: D-sedoheptulose 7-phosphate isomerase [Ignavibacteriales bacterium]|nr:D-sedoheptulose 7-phosphate isomerase [Ignavibacteriales bacterium]
MSIILEELNSHLDITKSFIENCSDEIAKISDLLISTIQNGKKIILFGNGGSAADAQHIAAELSGRYKKERKGLPALALTTDTSALTAISNDYGFEFVFARQVEAIANEGDCIIGISASGTSENIIKGLQKGKEIGCILVGLSGNAGGKMKDICDFNLIVPSKVTARIQEMHILAGHIFCQMIEDNI